ncbi:hypothetical protein D3C77_700410 [compost metagenome]
MALQAFKRLAVQRDRALHGGQHAHHGFEQRGLAHAVAAHHGDDFTGSHGKVDTVDDFALAIA